MSFPVAEADYVWTLAPRWPDLAPAEQMALLAALLVLPAGMILWLSRREGRRLRWWQGGALTALRLAVVSVLWFVVALRPTLRRTMSEEVPGRVRVAVDLSASMATRDPQRTPAEKAELAQALKLSKPLDTLTRRQIAERLLAPEGMDLLARLAQHHRLELIGFDRQTWPGDVETWRALLASESEKQRDGTDLRLALMPSTGQGEEPLRGIVLLTDGRHNVGPPPLALATRLGQRGTPIYAVALGARHPPADLAVVEMTVPEKTYKGRRVPVQAQVRLTRLPAQELTVELRVDGKLLEPDHRAILKHDGADHTYRREFQATLDEPGIHTFSVTARAASGSEPSRATRERAMLVGSEPARVLLVDGEARWEFRYLAAALTRDPLVRLDRVLFEQPRLGLVKDEQRTANGLPRRSLPGRTEKDVDPLLGYDCIFLGDVAPSDLPIEDRRRLAAYVAARGGTLVLVAGKRYLPLAYPHAAASSDPLMRLLPISAPTAIQPPAGFQLQPTSEGERATFLQLEPDEPGEPWPHLPRHFWGVTGRRKPGATVLITSSSDTMAGLLVEQRYGVGRVVYVGLDSTWRWRSYSGDVHFHRFWGQLVLWAAADKWLAGGTDPVRYGTSALTYAPGDEVDVLVRLGDDLPARQAAEGAKAQLVRRDAGVDKVEAVVPLVARAANPRLLEGRARDLPPGDYRIRPEIPMQPDRLPVSGNDPALFRVLAPQAVELADLSVDRALLQNLAGRSNGALVEAAEAGQIADLLARRTERREVPTEVRPWQDPPLVWWTLGLLLSLLTLQWTWRKWLELP